ncbi:MAG TPA: sialate O-acetylesterase, partial [Chloroflexia bacterium]|nr:sialate O-acetylesterase [Chloroflexia bacterium]
PRQLARALGRWALLAAFVALLAGTCGVTWTTRQPSQSIPMFIFAGQSNMIVLKTNTADLPPEQRLSQSQVLFYRPTDSGGTWAPLQPPTTTGGGFGPEISAGARLTDLDQFPGVAIVKLAASGSNLYNEWNPEHDNSYYELLLNRVMQAKQSLEAQYPGDAVYFAGFFWMQGESDADNSLYAAAYQARLDHFIDRVRADYGEPDLPFVIGRVRPGPFTYAAQVRTAQANIAATKPGVALVNTDFLPQNGDHVHFSSAGTYQLGVLFADAWVTLSLLPTAHLPLVNR